MFSIIAYHFQLYWHSFYQEFEYFHFLNIYLMSRSMQIITELETSGFNCTWTYSIGAYLVINSFLPFWRPFFRPFFKPFFNKLNKRKYWELTAASWWEGSGGGGGFLSLTGCIRRPRDLRTGLSFPHKSRSSFPDRTAGEAGCKSLLPADALTKYSGRGPL